MTTVHAIRKWCTVLGKHENVTFSTDVNDIVSWKGILMTDYLISDSITIGGTSPAGTYAKLQIMLKNGVEYYGYMGTRNQHAQLYPKYAALNEMLHKFGLSTFYHNATYNADARNWSSTQQTSQWVPGTYAAWTYSEKYGWISTGGCNPTEASSAILPIFSIPLS